MKEKLGWRLLLMGLFLFTLSIGIFASMVQKTRRQDSLSHFITNVQSPRSPGNLSLQQQQAWFFLGYITVSRGSPLQDKEESVERVFHSVRTVVSTTSPERAFSPLPMPSVCHKGVCYRFPQVEIWDGTSSARF